MQSTLKKQAKVKLNSHFGFFFLLFLPYVILYIVGNTLDGSDYVRNRDVVLPTSVQIGALLLLLASLILVGIQFVSLDNIQNNLTYEKGLLKSLNVFSSAKYFWGAIGIGLLKYIWVFFWTLLLIVPGIVKEIAYSQAFYIYYDSIEHGESIRFRDAITQSRHMMYGHKWEYFVLNLSFIGWNILVFLTAGLAGIWIFPYTNLTYANYYEHLKQTTLQ
ncbi:DUF975 family protein [Ligilactobacillus pobuzihii]|uniref:DUF975 family protein n=1 Tax=Ligilactobacillus pobuzihii TaxID=449659 RepID=UPI0019D131AF|nr:DUF975 family protein [Ligilactobacillus pobuzihii]MBN7274353.1 DUF975 family protein [Ligilactobacillus pobuzihii]